jgi:hypothetical protein
LRDIDEDELPPDDGPDVPAVKVVPDHVVAYLGEDKTVTVRVRTDLGLSEAQVRTDPEGVVELVDGQTIQLAPHRRRPDLMTGQIRMRPLIPDAETLLIAGCGENSGLASVETRPEAEVVEVAVEPPDDLKFERDSYRLTWNKKKTLRIQAPAEIVASNGDALRVTSSDPGVVVLGAKTQMKLDEELDFYTAAVTVEGRVLHAHGTLRAELGPASAVANAVVVRDEDGSNLRIEFADEDAGNSRAVIEPRKDGGSVMKIMGRHPAISRYLGPGPDFAYQERPLTQAVVAEIAASEATRIVMEKKYPLGKELDAPAMYAEHLKYAKKYLSACHRALVPAPLDGSEKLDVGRERDVR